MAKEVGFNGPADRGGSKLQEQTNAKGNHKQPKGKSIGYTSEVKWKPAGKNMGNKRPEVGFNGPADRGGSELQDQTNGPGNHKQPSGKSIEAGTTDVAEHHKGNTFGGARYVFSPPKAVRADGYGHSITQRNGPLRMSGVKGAHRVGHRGK